MNNQPKTCRVCNNWIDIDGQCIRHGSDHDNTTQTIREQLESIYETGYVDGFKCNERRSREIVDQALDQIETLLMEAIGGNYKHERTRTPTHGPCCTCQVCGEYHEDCREGEFETKNEEREAIRSNLKNILGKDQPSKEEG